MTKENGLPTSRLPQRTVLVHDYLNQYGGAERLLEVMHDLAPQAPVYTSMYDADALPATYRTWDIHTTWINRIPTATTHHQRLLPAYPIAFERMRLPDCDLVLSSSSAFAKMVRRPRNAVHISYIHSPMRFAWDLDRYIQRERMPDALRVALRPVTAALRARDRATLPRVDRFIANSTVVQDRIRSYWGRDATVIYPPVDVHAFTPAPAHEVDSYFLMVSRLVPYKRFDLAIEVCNKLGLPLWIAGSGRDRARLEAMAGQTIRFLGYVSDEELRRLYAHARAAIFMSEDDFGIAQVEAQAAGRPVIALGLGGAIDTVRDDETGILVRDQMADSLVDAIRRFEHRTFNTDLIVRHARSFSRQRFEQDLTSLVNETLARHRSGEAILWN